MSSETSETHLRKLLECAWDKHSLHCMWWVRKDVVLQPKNALRVVSMLRKGTLDSFRFAEEVRAAYKNWCADVE
ncbi:MAG: hypothetical protein OXI01_04480 [Albidovulum sp.]|nr:hypothetical protein [Albidovulum sp.]